jgi:hypothetical protein
MLVSFRHELEERGAASGGTSLAAFRLYGPRQWNGHLLRPPSSAARAILRGPVEAHGATQTTQNTPHPTSCFLLTYQDI